MATSGLITVKSRFRVAETIDRLADIVFGAGLLVFARIDHGANASEIGARGVGGAILPRMP